MNPVRDTILCFIEHLCKNLYMKLGYTLQITN